MTHWEILARNLQFSSERDMWKTLYTDRKLSVAVLSNKFACAPHTIRSRLKANGIEMRPRGGPNNEKIQVDTALLEEIQAKGVIQTAKDHQVTPQTLYKRVYYNKGVKLREQQGSTPTSETGTPSPDSEPTSAPASPENDE